MHHEPHLERLMSGPDVVYRLERPRQHANLARRVCRLWRHQVSSWRSRGLLAHLFLRH